MEELTQEAFNLNKELKALLPIKAEWQQNLDEKFRLEFNYNSNHIEGNTLTYGETKLLIMFDKTKGNHELREYEEMKAHDVAYSMVKEWAADKSRTLTEMDIKTLNQILLVKPFYSDAQTPDGKPTRKRIEPGQYKSTPNHVIQKNGEEFRFASVEDTPIKMKELLDWYLDYESHDFYAYNAIEVAALLHYRFVVIHPFDDGNGRVARLLMNYVLLRNDYPPVVIKSDDKANYFFALNQADASEFSAFIAYIAKQLIWSLKLSISASKGEDISEDGDIDKELSLLKAQLNTDKVLNEKRSIHNVADVIQYDILPILVEIEHKCNSVEEYYFEKGRTIEVKQIGTSAVNMLGTVKSDLLEIIPKTLTQWKSEHRTFSEFNYSLNLIGFKNNKHAHSSYAHIRVLFREFNYEIAAPSLGSERADPRPYGVRLSHEEVKKYVNQNVKGIIEDIKRYTKN
ncbi:MAG: hypothetical protein COA58_10110 [Bacteroidetes bacterium]|nr:MAG: hypothetical protein COA58_10110 [Bacteroidota bacterium]